MTHWLMWWYRCCNVGAVVCGVHGTTQIVVSCSPTANCWITTSSSLHTPLIIAFRVVISISVSISSYRRPSSGACWRSTDVNRTSVMMLLRCAAITAPPDSRNPHILHVHSSKPLGIGLPVYNARERLSRHRFISGVIRLYSLHQNQEGSNEAGVPAGLIHFKVAHKKPKLAKNIKAKILQVAKFYT